jgi:regulator of cell morphogenesis and NO signaling
MNNDVDSLIEVWSKKTDSELIEFLITDYHDKHRGQLLSLIELSEYVEKNHISEPLCPRGLTSHLKSIMSDLMEHMSQEEKEVFPVIALGQKDVILNQVRLLKYEHEQQVEALDTLLFLTNDLLLPKKSCPKWWALYNEISEFYTDVHEHMTLENNVLFEY